MAEYYKESFFSLTVLKDYIMSLSSSQRYEIVFLKFQPPGPQM